MLLCETYAKLVDAAETAIVEGATVATILNGMRSNCPDSQFHSILHENYVDYT